MKTSIKKYLLSLIPMCLIALLSLSVNAENMKKLGSMNVHYIAIGSTFFTPEIAKAYGITRSRYNGLINISVLDNSKSGLPAKTVSITGKGKNNVGQFKELAFTEVREGNAIYYLAQVNYDHEETIHFSLMITDGKEKQELKFTQKFYVD